MYKVTAALTALLLTSGATPAVPYAVNEAAIVQVFCPESTGTAYKVSETGYITANHVVDTPGCKVGGVLITDVKQDTKADFASFQGPASKATIPVSCKGFAKGQTYVAVGHGLGLPFKMQMPWLSTDFVLEGFTAFIGEGLPGMSGGPVLNRKGEAVGSVNMRWPTRSFPLRDTPACGEK